MKQQKKYEYQTGGDASMDCPEATLNPQLDISNRDNATADENTAYNPTGGTQENACGNCALFDVSQRMKQCMQEGGETIGYCWPNQFKCEASAVCNKWEQGGPITADDVSYDIAARYTEEQVPMNEPNIEAPEIMEPPMQPPMAMPEMQMAKFGGAVRGLPKAGYGNMGRGNSPSFQGFIPRKNTGENYRRHGQFWNPANPMAGTSLGDSGVFNLLGNIATMGKNWNLNRGAPKTNKEDYMRTNISVPNYLNNPVFDQYNAENIMIDPNEKWIGKGRNKKPNLMWRDDYNTREEDLYNKYSYAERFINSQGNPEMTYHPQREGTVPTGSNFSTIPDLYNNDDWIDFFNNEGNNLTWTAQNSSGSGMYNTGKPVFTQNTTKKCYSADGKTEVPCPQKYGGPLPKAQNMNTEPIGSENWGSGTEEGYTPTYNYNEAGIPELAPAYGDAYEGITEEDIWERGIDDPNRGAVPPAGIPGVPKMMTLEDSETATRPDPRLGEDTINAWQRNNPTMMTMLDANGGCPPCPEETMGRGAIRRYERNNPRPDHCPPCDYNTKQERRQDRRENRTGLGLDFSSVGQGIKGLFKGINSPQASVPMFPSLGGARQGTELPNFQDDGEWDGIDRMNDDYSFGDSLDVGGYWNNWNGNPGNFSLDSPLSLGSNNAFGGNDPFNMGSDPLGIRGESTMNASTDGFSPYDAGVTSEGTDWGDKLFEPGKNRRDYRKEQSDRYADLKGKEKRKMKGTIRDESWEENPNRLGNAPVNKYNKFMDSKPMQTAMGTVHDATNVIGAFGQMIEQGNKSAQYQDWRQNKRDSASISPVSYTTNYAFDERTGDYALDDLVTSRMDSRAGGELYDIDDEMLRKLIAAGAGIEIL